MQAATDRRAARLTGAIPVVLAVVVLLAAASLVSPWVRRQLAHSFTREPSGYVELYFADESAARACLAVSGRLAVSAVVRSHLDGSGPIAYDVSAVSAQGTRTDHVTGSISPSPGGRATIDAAVGVPSRLAYTITVALPGRSERLLLHCTGAGS